MSKTHNALLWSFAERYTSLVLSLASSMIIARLLTPAEIGVFSVCAASMAIAGTVRDFGVSEYILQERQLTDGRLRATFAVAITTSWSIGLALFLVRHLAAAYYAEPRVADILAILTINFVLLPFASPAFALLNREMAFRKIFAVQFWATLAQTGTSVGLAYAGYGPYSLAWASVVGIAAQALIVTVMRPKASLILPSYRESAAVFKYGMFQMGARVLDTVAGNMHEFIIARQFGFASVGIFSRAKGLIDMFHSNVTLAITRVAAPAMATAHRADQSLAEGFARGTAIFTSLSWPFFAFLTIAAPEIVAVLLGSQWGQSGHIASLLAFSMLPSALFALCPSVLAATGNVRLRLWISLQWCPVHIIGLLLASRIGLDAMAIFWGFTNCLMVAIYSRYMCRLLKASVRRLYAPSMRSAVLAASTAAAQYASVAGTRHLEWHPLPTVALAAVVGVVSWALAARILRHPAYQEALRITQGLRQRLGLAV